MKVLVIYDSVFGNTEKIAFAIWQALASQVEISLKRVNEVDPEQLAGLDLLIVGSPTRAFRPTKSTSRFLKKLPKNCLKGVKVAAFDTRVSIQEVGNPILSCFAAIFGYAAAPIAKILRQKGGLPTQSPEGYLVNGSEGPLKEGELERAASWAQSLF
jgi:flavodoxin I